PFFPKNATSFVALGFPDEKPAGDTNHLRVCSILSDVETIATYPVSEAAPPRVTMSGVDAPNDETRLVERAARGDVGAFEELYRENAGRVYLLCLRMCGDPSLAEELAQEAFVRAWQKLGSFRGASAFSTWLHRVTVNVVLGNRRSAARREARVTSVGDRLPVEGAVSDPSPGQAMDLERAIAALPEGARTAFVLHDIEGYRHKEISRLTGLAVGTSKAQLHRARRLLRKALTS
ncbi:MAG: RNA polymerase sigma factor, partial [Acidobacteriota bacterium]